MKKCIAALLIVTVLTGCATNNYGQNYRPVVDMKDKDIAVYESDLRECQTYATQVTGGAERAAQGAALGALFGAALMAAGGARGNYVSRGAAVGATSGAVHGGVAGEQHQRMIIMRCLAGRGYAVLG